MPLPEDIESAFILRSLFSCFACDKGLIHELISYANEKDSINNYNKNISESISEEKLKLNIGLSRLVEMESDNHYNKLIQQCIFSGTKYNSKEMTKKLLIDAYKIIENKSIEKEKKKILFLINISCVFQDICFTMNGVVSNDNKQYIEKMKWLQEIIDISILYKNEEDSSYFMRKIVFGIINYLWINNEKFVFEDKISVTTDHLSNEISYLNGTSDKLLQELFNILTEKNDNLTTQFTGFDFIFDNSNTTSSSLLENNINKKQKIQDSVKTYTLIDLKQNIFI